MSTAPPERFERDGGGIRGPFERCSHPLGLWRAEPLHRFPRATSAGRGDFAETREVDLFNRHFDPFNLLVDDGSKTIVVLNPKVMTSFTRRLFRDGWSRFRGADDPSRGRYPWDARARVFPLLSPLDYIRLAVDQRDFKVFALVRNPYSRTYSAWRDKFFDPHMQGGGDERAYPRSMRGGELRRFRRFAARHGMAGAAANTLVPFATFLDCISRQPAGRRNHHWDTQTSVIQSQHFRFHRVYRMEDERTEFFCDVFGRMGFDPDWITTRLARKVNASSANLSAVASNVDTRAITKMGAMFAEDFVSFGYDPGEGSRSTVPAFPATTAAE